MLNIAGHHLTAARTVVKNCATSRGDADPGEFSQRHQPSGGVPEQKVLDLLRTTAVFRLQDDRNIEEPAAVVNLSHRRSLVGGLDSLEHIHRSEAELHQLPTGGCARGCPDRL